MALVHLIASDGKVRLDAGDGVARCLSAALAATPSGAPVVILIHGYKYDPSPEGRAAGRDPHPGLFGMEAGPEATRAADWPSGLGFCRDGLSDGLCIGFGWPARAPLVASLACCGRNGVSEAYRRAGEAGALLHRLIAIMHAARPDLRFDLFGHSLGARVALAALGAPGIGRVILLGAAEHASVARARLRAARSARVYSFLSRQNDPFDTLFEWLAPAPPGGAAGALGRAGLGERRPDWIDLQFDGAHVETWLARRGVALAPDPAPVCHRSFYRRPGAMTLYRAILRDRARWSIAALRAAGAPEEIMPRWSRLTPTWRRASPAPPEPTPA